MDKDVIKNLAEIVENCRQAISKIGTPLNNQPNLSEPMEEAVEHLGKAHASLLRVVTILQK